MISVKVNVKLCESNNVVLTTVIIPTFIIPLGIGVGICHGIVIVIATAAFARARTRAGAGARGGLGIGRRRPVGGRAIGRWSIWVRRGRTVRVRRGRSVRWGVMVVATAIIATTTTTIVATVGVTVGVLGGNCGREECRRL